MHFPSAQNWWGAVQRDWCGKYINWCPKCGKIWVWVCKDMYFSRNKDGTQLLTPILAHVTIHFSLSFGGMLFCGVVTARSLRSRNKQSFWDTRGDRVYLKQICSKKFKVKVMAQLHNHGLRSKYWRRKVNFSYCGYQILQLKQELCEFIGPTFFAVRAQSETRAFAQVVK